VKILREILKQFPNLHIDMSWDLVADKVVVEGCAEQWIMLIEEFSDYFIFGSDVLVPTSAESWNTTFKKYEALRDALNEETRRKVFLKNYERLMLPARKAVRNYEATQLQHDLKTLDDDFRRELKALDAARANGLSRSTTTTMNSPTTTSSSTASSSTNPPISTLSIATASASSASTADTNENQEELAFT
jgi:hypothetical protein